MKSANEIRDSMRRRRKWRLIVSRWRVIVGMNAEWYMLGKAGNAGISGDRNEVGIWYNQVVL